MALLINQTVVNDKDTLVNLERVNHTDSFEYLPNAKNMTYQELVTNSDIPIFLAIKLTAYEGEEREREIINNSGYLPTIVCTNRVLNKHREFKTLSISYQQALNRNKTEGLMINALILTENNKPLENKTINSLIEEISIQLKIKVPSNEEVTELTNSNTITEKTDNTSNDIDQKNFSVNNNAKEVIHDTSDTITNKTQNIENINVVSDNIPKTNNALRPGMLSLLKNRMKAETILEEINNKEPLTVNENSVKDSANNIASTVNQEDVLPISDLNNTDLNEVKNSTNYDKTLNDIDNQDLNSTNTQKDKDLCISIENPDNINKDIQNKAYIQATDSTPFLNAIDNYIPTFNINTLTEDAPIYDIHEEDEFLETTASKAKIKTTFDKVMDFFTNNERTSVRRTLNEEIPQDQFMLDVKMYVDKYCQIPEEDKPMFMDKLKRAFFSYYVLTPAIMDENISDIRVLSPDNINVKVYGKHYIASNLKFINSEDYIRFIEGLIIRNKVTIGESNILLFTDKDYNPDYILRFNICLPTINSTGLPYIHIRKVPKNKTTMSDLIKAGMLDKKIASYLLDKIATSKGIVFAGPSASGKTTLMNACIDYIPKSESVLCIQESEELFSNVHPNIYFQHILKYPNGETKVGLSELGQNGLVCDSGYFIIGESKGKEVRDLLRASNTGHKCWTSVHSQSSKETITRLADYVKYGADYSFKEAVRMLKDLEVIIYIQNFKIMEITEIIGYDDEKEQIIYKPIYRRNI